MRKIRFVLLFALLLSLAGCSSAGPPDAVEIIATTESVEAPAPDSSVAQTEAIPEETDFTDTDPETPAAHEENNLPRSSNNSESTSAEAQSGTVSQAEAPKTSASSETDNSASAPAETPKQESSPPTAEDPPAETPSVQYATAADTQEIAAKMVEYLNFYRTEQGSSVAINLPGLTGYAEYRSRQLVSNFAHDTLDERAAATALKYGEYVDPSLYGMDGDPYYCANAREAIGKADYAGTVDSVAQRLALGFRNSASHWAYVGSSEYGYIAVGVTYENGIWYCAVTVASVNTDEY